MAGRPRKIQQDQVKSTETDSIKITETKENFYITNFGGYSPNYVETGSCTGESIRRALDAGFMSISSVEIMDSFYNRCVERYKGNSIVRLFHGKSTDHLADMLPASGTKSVILLDAHPCGPHTGGHEDLMKNGNSSEFNQHNIISKELDIILSNGNNHIILIDDVSGDNEETQSYCRKLLHANPGYQFYLYDELIGEKQFKNKILVAII